MIEFYMKQIELYEEKKQLATYKASYDYAIKSFKDEISRLNPNNLQMWVK